MDSSRVIKYFLLTLFFGLSFSASSQCSYTLTLLDSYGDGWNGNSMYYKVSGSTATTVTMNSGSTVSFQISATTGDSTFFGWNGGGVYQSECTFKVVDNATGTTLYTSSTGNLLSTTAPQYNTVCTSTSGSVPCLYSSPYYEAFSGAGNGWISPTSSFNIGSLNGCWNRDSYSTYNWIKAPSTNTSVASFTGPSGDHTNGGQGFLSTINSFFASSSSSTSLITPYIDLANDSVPQVSFWYHMFGADIEKLEISIATDTAGIWTVLDSILPVAGTFVSPSSPWQQAVYPISNYVDDTVAFKFTAFRNNNGSSFGGYSNIGLDDFSVAEDTFSCSNPINFQLVSLNLSSAQVTWDTTGASDYEIQWAQGTTAASGSTAIISTNSYNLTGLASNSTYTLRVRAICGSNDTSAWSTNLTITTSCGAFVAPWIENFEGSDWDAPAGWSTKATQGTFGDCFIDSGSVFAFWKVARLPQYNTDQGPNTDHTPTGAGKYIAVNYQYGNMPPNLSVTGPWVALDSLINPELRFWVHSYSGEASSDPFGKLTAKIQTLNGQTIAVFDTSGALQSAQTSPWKEVIVPLDQLTSNDDTVRVIFSYNAFQTNDEQPFAVDDVSIVEAPSCPQPRYLKTLSINKNDASVKWSSGGASNHQIRYKKVNTNAWTIISSSSTQTVLNNLDPNTKYRWEVRDSCGATDQSTWVKGPTFYTTCTVFTAPYTNSFTNSQWKSPSPFLPSGKIDNCFTSFENNSDGFWWSGARSGYDHNSFTGPTSDHTGGLSGYLFTKTTTSTADTAKIELPAVYLGQLQSPEFSFWYHMYGGAIQGLKVYVRKSGGSDTLIANFNGQQSTSSNSFAWLKKTCSLSSFQGDTVIVSFEAYKNSGTNIFYTVASAIAIDDIAFEGTSTCPAPSLLTASNIGTNTAEISWQGTSNVSIVEYDTVGFALGTGQMINPASSPYTLTGLQPNTTYAVFVKDSCAANLVSSNATINFTTSPCPSVTAQGTTTLNGTIVTALNTGSLNDSILWNWGDGNSSIGNSVSYSYSTPGIYSVQQIAYNDCGNSDTLSTTLTICGAVAANFGFSGQGSTRLFSSNTSVGVALSYAWNFGDGSSSTSANPSHTYVSAGSYTVTLTVTDACGTVDVTTSAIDICQTIIPNFTNTFSGSTFTFSAQPAGLSNYDWNFGDGSTGSGLNVTHTYSSIGTYYVTLNCTDTCGGSYSVLDTVSTCPALNANFNFNIASSGSNGMLVQFFANVSGSLGLIWDWGDGSQTVTQAASISHQYATVNLNYTITLKAYNECGDTVEVMKSLNEVGLPEQSVLKYKTYPNPVSGSLTIEFTRPLNGTYYLYDVTGRLVRSERFAESAFVVFSTSDLSSGSYILRVESDQIVTSSIVFKQ